MTLCTLAEEFLLEGQRYHETWARGRGKGSSCVSMRGGEAVVLLWGEFTTAVELFFTVGEVLLIGATTELGPYSHPISLR